ncbi:hypothetical protein BC937DRAFT_87872 [Endogone sp. FLAS-F59071]|nr:hypothetical protein BC937DRAFT_88068 [Endogone sp. FLAS-F59071]RUS22673.1 hypothetical protein BC937DRAFT_87872 [Endogone sp. FLAS-F59071]|eukprot:RUS19018.1 hypothetical protein BC937DRAFT_88068 [Endogone sp. FLAS-F59071]
MATPRVIPITRIVPTEDGGSCFVDAEVALTNATSIGFLSDMENAKGIIFRETDGSYDLDFHNAPRKQYILILNGAVDITTTDGVTRRFKDGDIFLVEDTTGRGHKSKNVNGGTRRSVFIALE